MTDPAPPALPPPPTPLWPTPPWPAVLVWLIAVTVGIEAALVAADHGLIGSARWRPMAYQYGGFWAGLLHGWRPNFAGQPVTMFLTHGFLHGGPGHMAGNMLALAALAPMVIARAGQRGFAVLYLCGVLGGGLVFGLISVSPAPMVGASGAIFGLVGVWAAWQAADARAAGQGWARVLIRAGGITAGLALLNLLMWLLAGGLLAWETHLGGYLAGAAGAMALRRRV